jgi:hypothetical protein
MFSLYQFKTIPFGRMLSNELKKQIHDEEYFLCPPKIRQIFKDLNIKIEIISGSSYVGHCSSNFIFKKNGLLTSIYFNKIRIYKQYFTRDFYYYDAHLCKDNYNLLFSSTLSMSDYMYLHDNNNDSGLINEKIKELHQDNRQSVSALFTFISKTNIEEVWLEVCAKKYHQVLLLHVSKQLIENRFHPRNISKFVDWGFDDADEF